MKAGVLRWVDNDSALCYVVFKNDVYVTNVATNSFEIPSGTSEQDRFTVCAANRMGGLGPASEALTLLDNEPLQTGVADMHMSDVQGDGLRYDLSGRPVENPRPGSLFIKNGRIYWLGR